VPRPAGDHRQAGLGAVHRLALGLLVEAEHHRPLGWIQVQPDDVDEFVLEVRVVGDLEGVDLPRLEAVIGADLGDGVLTDLERFASDRVVQCVPPSSGLS
jgi:hypothetical protein